GLGVEFAPAVGGEDGAVERAVELEQGVGETFTASPLLLRRQRAALADRLDGVVEISQPELRVRLLPLLPVAIDGLAEPTDLGGLRLGRNWERKGLERPRAVVAGVVPDAESAPARECPGDVDAAAEDAEVVGVVERDGDDAVLGEHLL